MTRELVSTGSGSLVTHPLSLTFWHLNTGLNSFVQSSASICLSPGLFSLSLEPVLFSLIPEIFGSKMTDIVYFGCFN